MTAAAASGFAVESYERVHTLVQLLDGITTHPFLAGKVALKGGTALNLFVFNLPRLSVDIDLNYVASADRSVMLADRPRIEEAIRQVCGRLGIVVKRVPSDHAGGKWRLSYTTSLGRPGTVEVDLNFMLRAPLWPLRRRSSQPIMGYTSKDVLVLDNHELAAGKLAALVARSASRDVFDARELLRQEDLDNDKLRLGFVVYGGLNREDWRTIVPENVQTTAADVGAQLAPMLRTDVRPRKDELEEWTASLVQETRDLMKAVLPLAPRELEFIERLNTAGDIVPDLITADSEMQAVIRSHPGLKWKAMNVRKHHGLPALDESTVGEPE